MNSVNTAPTMVGIILVAFAFSFWGLAAQETRVRSNRGLCEEVEHELGEAVKAGLLEPGEALQVSQRCYDRFRVNLYD